ncbi:MAG: hypothetical protein CMJ50_02720 [Planctomycetaceae bacterium]|nr:hypothetical protein [Planctomycetaceae bacterium]
MVGDSLQLPQSSESWRHGGRDAKKRTHVLTNSSRWNGSTAIIESLLAAEADPISTPRGDETPLLATVGVGVLGNGDEAAGTEDETIEAVKLLLKLGADINAIDDHGK